MSKNNNMSILLKGILLENPVLVLVLGTCPTLAVTNSVIGALSMGIAAMAVLICSNAVISLIRNFISDTVRIPCYIVVISGFVTIVKLLIQAFLPEIFTLLGVYLDLITVNCIILGRAELFAGKNSVGKSVLDGIGMGIGFTLALILIATVREVFGLGSFAGFEIPFIVDHKIEFFVKAPGGLMVYGLMIAAVTALTHGKAPFKKDFACNGCPNAGVCNTACENLKEEN